MNTKDKIGTLKQRIEQRIGRSFGECDSCGKPTRSHKVGGGLVCHDCHTPHQPRLVTDGGWQTENEQGDTHGAEGCDSNGTATWSSAARMSLVESVREWLNRNDPLPRSELDDIKSTFIREAEKAINHPQVGGNGQLREVTGEQAGLFAAEHDAVIYETRPKQSVAFGELMGLPVSDGWVPVLVCGPTWVKETRRAFHETFHHFADLREMFLSVGEPSAENRRAIPDGGQPIGENENGSEMIEGDEIPETMRQRDEWFNFVLEVKGADDGERKIDKRPVAPYNGGELTYAAWVSNKEEDRTDFETASKFTTYGPKEIGYLNDRTQLKLAENKLGLGYPIPKRDHRDPSESVTLIDLDDVRDPDDGALHPRAIELIEEADSFAQVSSSGTGIHILVIGALPDDVSTIDSSLPEHDRFPDAEIEVYDNGRFIAMTGDRLEGTPTEVNKRESLLADLADEFDTNENKSADYDYEPTFSKTHVSEVEETDNAKTVADAMHHAGLGDGRIKSKKTNVRANGTIDFDPSFARSESGTRLAYPNDGSYPKWIYRKGDIGMNTAKVVALEEGIISSPSSSLKGDDFWETAQAMRDRGFDIPKYNRGKKHLNWASILPDTPDTEQEPNITRQDLHNLVEDQIKDLMVGGDEAVVDAIMSSGKTYSSLKAGYELDEPITFLTGLTRLYGQIKGYALDVGFDEGDIAVLPSAYRDCSTFKGEHSDDWEQKVKKQYDHGAKASEIHTYNDDIPCSPSDDEADNCKLERLWDEFDPDDYELIIGNHKHAYLPNVTQNRQTIIDEYPGDSFTQVLEGDQLIEAVNFFLADTGPRGINDFDDLLKARHDRRKKNRALGWFDDYDLRPDSKGAIEHAEDGYHAHAAHAVYGILKASPVGEDSDFERAFMPGVENHALFFTTSDQHSTYRFEIRNNPNLEYAKSVIGLDGTPLTTDSDEFTTDVPEWSKAVGVNFGHEKILNNEERADFIANTLDHTYIKTTSSLKPYSSGRYNNPIEDEILLREVTEKYGNGSPPVVVTSKTVSDEYEQSRFKFKGIADEFEYPGNLRGTNEYADTRLAVQLGSSHHGDFEVARRTAWLGETIDPEGRGEDRDYGSEIGNKVVEQMREQQTLQNVLRFGRDGDGATIILHTSGHPDWLPIAAEGSISPWNDSMKQITEAWQDLPDDGVTTQDVAEHDAVDVTERTVLSNLHRLSDELGLLECKDDPDDGRRNLWHDDGLSGVERHDQATVDMPDLDDEELDEMGLLDDDGEVIADEMEISRYSINTSDFRFYGGARGSVSGAGDNPGVSGASSGGSGGGTGVSGGLEE